MTRAATSPELAYFRTPGKWSKSYAAILTPPIIYRARINQTFSSTDQVLSIIYDTGSGTLANVLPDMEVWIGSSLDASDKGICRLRDKDVTHFYISEVSDISFADNDYVTIVGGYGVWARPVRITSGGTVYMDETTYSDQHTNWDPMPNMGSHRVLKLTGSSVSTSFDGSSSFCPGSSISSYAWSCSSASSSSNTTTATPSFTFNSVGWHLVYLIVTAANGKSFFGIRYVFVWNSSNTPAPAEISGARCDAETGGWEMNLTLRSGASLSTVYDKTMVILFTEDWYGDTQTAIGPVSGSENIKFVGWITSEGHHLESEQGSVTFTVKGAAFWMAQIPSWPDGVEFASSATAWTNVANLTVDLGVYHFLRWRSTITRIMDVTLTGDTRLTQEVSSSAQNLWGQLKEMTWNQIYARAGVNAQGQLSIQVHPNLIPTVDRVAPTVMAITKADYTDELDFERSVMNDVGIVDMSGVIVTAPNTATAKFALSPGHSLPHNGEWDLQTNLLLSSQSQVITLAGLYRGWRNNKFKSITIRFAAPIALIDCFPNQKCTISISSSDNIRGFAYSGGLIPTSVNLSHDPRTGYLNTEVTFEAETSETSAMQGDTPGSGSTDNPPSPSFPPLPTLPPVFPGIPNPTAEGPKKVIFILEGFGLVYTENFNASLPDYYTVNNGLTTVNWNGTSVNQAERVAQFFVCPNGSVYVMRLTSVNLTGWNSAALADYYFLARAPSIGSSFVTIHDSISMGAPSSGQRRGIYSANFNRLQSEQVAFCIRDGASDPNLHLFIGAAGTYTGGTNALPPSGGGSGANTGLSYGLGKWVHSILAEARIVSGDGTTIESTKSLPTADIASFNQNSILRAGASGRTYISGSGGVIDLIIGDNNLVTTSSPGFSPTVFSFTGLACDPTGNLLMGEWGGKGKSSDGGVTWAALPNLPVGASWRFAYAGPGASLTGSRWIAGGATIQYTDDFGTTWHDKTSSSLLAIDPTPNIVAIQVLEY